MPLIKIHFLNIGWLNRNLKQLPTNSRDATENGPSPQALWIRGGWGKWQTKTPRHQLASSGSTSFGAKFGFGVLLKDILSSTGALVMNIKGVDTLFMTSLPVIFL